MAGENVEPEITVTSAETIVKNSLIVVSNRLPFVLKKDENGVLHRHARLVTLKFYHFYKIECFFNV